MKENCGRDVYLKSCHYFQAEFLRESQVYAIKLPLSSVGLFCNSVLTVCILVACFNQIALGGKNASVQSSNLIFSHISDMVREISQNGGLTGGTELQHRFSTGYHSMLSIGLHPPLTSSSLVSAECFSRTWNIHKTLTNETIFFLSITKITWFNLQNQTNFVPYGHSLSSKVWPSGGRHTWLSTAVCSLCMHRILLVRAEQPSNTKEVS